MLTEDTGSNFLDSGDHYGRHHEKNSKKTIKDFDKEPVELYQKEGGWINRRVSVYHYLMNLGLSFTPLCEYFTNLNRKHKNWDADADVYGVSKEAWEWLTDNYEVKVLRTFNSYNNDSDLSQVIQGSNVLINGESYMILQVHNGCDVRGGYTDARLFKHDDKYYDYIPEWKSQTEIEEEIDMGLIVLSNGE